MSFEAWTVFALFWVVFVTTPGPNAVNCIQNGMTLGFRRAFVGVLAILTQAAAFLTLSALGVTALIAASPTGFFIAKLTGAGFLVWTGIRNWRRAGDPAPVDPRPSSHVYLHALATATINPKSVAGYLAAFSAFVQPDVPIRDQMAVIVPTALTLTTLSYSGFTLLGVLMGRSALAAVFNAWVRRLLALCFIVYGVLLGFAATPMKG
ncbi:LysE family translocator [Marinibacterium profundimaris]|uniref:Amino acid transporter LysE n=1 Tax=Marinibacterium profundimaris TaxID=1679460 RepID=A0A225NIM1_9RHOB|nr:LysE family translocator [Marinibacterium profundimaris]OWU73574.1 amino acid transporter LysE [Marinibacterium profundimaris]